MSKVFAIPGSKYSIPSVAFGTGTAWFKYGRNDIDEKLIDGLVTAIKTGFTHIDGAEIYNTAIETGKAIKKSGVKREELWLTDKYFAGDGTYTYHSEEANPLESLKASLKKLDVSYVDLYLLHGPHIKKESHGFTLTEAWGYVEEAQKLGLARTIGVSNFGVDDLKEILAVAKVKPQVHQIEFNAYLQNQTPGIVEFSKLENILIEGYSPLTPLTKGKGGPLDPVIEQLSKKYSKTDSQILLRWVLQQGILPVTTSSKESRMKEYLDIYDFELTKDEVENITNIGKQKTVRQWWIAEYSKYD